MLAPQPSAHLGVSSSLLLTCCSSSLLSRPFQPWQIFGLPGYHRNSSFSALLPQWSSDFDGSLFWNCVCNRV